MRHMRIAIYFPSQSDDKIPKDKFQIVREMVEKELIGMFGGLTEYKAKGFWKNKQGQIIQEDVRILEAFGETYPQQKLQSIMEKIKTTLKQQSVAYSIDNVMNFSHAVSTESYKRTLRGIWKSDTGATGPQGEQGPKLTPASTITLLTVGITEPFHVNLSTVEKTR